MTDDELVYMQLDEWGIVNLHERQRVIGYYQLNGQFPPDLVTDMEPNDNADSNGGSDDELEQEQEHVAPLDPPNQNTQTIEQPNDEFDFFDSQTSFIHLLFNSLPAFISQSIRSDDNVNVNGISFSDPVKLVLTKNELNALPVSVYCKTNESDSCCVCMMEFENEDIIRKLQCVHIFHRMCIDQWLTKQSHECPMCKHSAGKYVPILD
jgi:hypothetical protein